MMLSFILFFAMLRSCLCLRELRFARAVCSPFSLSMGTQGTRLLSFSTAPSASQRRVDDSSETEEVLTPQQINRKRRIENQARKKRLQEAMPMDKERQEPLFQRDPTSLPSSSSGPEEKDETRSRRSFHQQQKQEQHLHAIRSWSSSILGSPITDQEALEFLRAFTHSSHRLGFFFNNTTLSLHGEFHTSTPLFILLFHCVFRDVSDQGENSSESLRSPQGDGFWDTSSRARPSDHAELITVPSQRCPPLMSSASSLTGSKERKRFCLSL